MEKENGFTLVELLAVIAILAILVIIALPDIMGLFNEAKKNSFVTECKQIYKEAEQEWMKDSMFSTESQVYSRCKTCTGKTLQLSGRQQLDYYVRVNKAGKIDIFKVSDGTYQFNHDGVLLITDIINAQQISTLNADDVLEITSSGGTTASEARIVCKRATTLHKEVCYQNNNYCISDFSYGQEITYGSLGTRGQLNPGDAFDCDVNGDGVYNSTNERFYYVSPKDADNSSNYATLIYYSNIDGTTPTSTYKTKYGDIMYGGPNISYLKLPTTDQWKKVQLSNTVRQIKNSVNGTQVERDGEINELNTFDYENKAARFLTIEEVKYACGSNNFNTNGYLVNCTYLMESSNYTSDSKFSYFLENWSSGAQYVYFGLFNNRKYSTNSFTNEIAGARPAIEVPLENIEI